MAWNTRRSRTSTDPWRPTVVDARRKNAADPANKGLQPTASRATTPAGSRLGSRSRRLRSRPLGVTLSSDAYMGTTTTVRTLVLVEGNSDAGAVRALADLLGCDLNLNQIQILSADGVTNFSRLLVEFVHKHPGAEFCGMYDVADERHVRRVLTHAAIPVAANESLESRGFFACVADLEDGLIRALGVEGVERVLEAQGELISFRRFQAMPQHRSTPEHRQLHRFLGTRATRKIRSAQRLVEALGLAGLPRPLVQLAARLLEAASRGPRRSDA